jgi:hypothetical protein
MEQAVNRSTGFRSSAPEANEVIILYVFVFATRKYDDRLAHASFHQDKIRIFSYRL